MCSAAFDFHLSVAILRAPEGMDFTGQISDASFIPDPMGPASPAMGMKTVGTEPVLTAVDSSANLKPSASTASGWTDGKTQSQETLPSHGSYL